MIGAIQDFNDSVELCDIIIAIEFFISSFIAIKQIEFFIFSFIKIKQIIIIYTTLVIHID